MTEEAKSRFIKWWVKEFTTKNGKQWFNVDIQKEDFNTLPVNDKGFVKMTIWKREELWKFWDTHFIVLNDFKPTKQEESKDDLPF